MTKIILKIFLIISYLLKEQFIKTLITELYKILTNLRQENNPRKKMQNKYPNYENFFIDSTPPLTNVVHKPELNYDK